MTSDDAVTSAVNNSHKDKMRLSEKNYHDMELVQSPSFVDAKSFTRAQVKNNDLQYIEAFLIRMD